MKNIIITKHASIRIKQRMGIKKKAQRKVVERAYARGIMHKDVSGRLKKYLDKTYLSHHNGNNIRIYGDNVFLFCNNVLLTVWVLPNDFKSVANKISYNKKSGDAIG